VENINSFMNIHLERYKQQIITMGPKTNKVVKEQYYNNGMEDTEENIISIERSGDQSVIEYGVNGVDFDLRQDDTVEFKGFVKETGSASVRAWKKQFLEDVGGDPTLLKACMLEVVNSDDGEGVGDTGWFPVAIKSDKTAAILSY